MKMQTQIVFEQDDIQKALAEFVARHQAFDVSAIGEFQIDGSKKNGFTASLTLDHTASAANADEQTEDAPAPTAKPTKRTSSTTPKESPEPEQEPEPVAATAEETAPEPESDPAPAPTPAKASKSAPLDFGAKKAAAEKPTSDASAIPDEPQTEEQAAPKTKAGAIFNFGS